MDVRDKGEIIGPEVPLSVSKGMRQIWRACGEYVKGHYEQVLEERKI